MNIRNFKAGDIITRNRPVLYDHSGHLDGSFLGKRCVFLGHDVISKIIFFSEDLYGPTDISYAREHWDEGWCRYPETMWQKISAKLKNPKEKQKALHD